MNRANLKVSCATQERIRSGGEASKKVTALPRAEARLENFVTLLLAILQE
jgi:hypothetical protein